MKLKLIDSVSEAGHPHRGSDDRSGFDAAGGKAWIIDGATSLAVTPLVPTAESDAAWFAERLSVALLGSGATSGLHELMETALGEIRAEAEQFVPTGLAGLLAWQMPSATMLIAHAAETGVEFAWIGDCVALIRARQKSVSRVGGDRSRALHASEAVMRMSPEDPQLFLRADRERVILEGKHCLSLRGKLQAFRARRMAVGAGAHLLIMSDGFYRLVDPLGLLNDADLLDAAVSDSLDSLLRRLRAEERRSPRTFVLKRHDDATALLLKVEAERTASSARCSPASSERRPQKN